MAPLRALLPHMARALARELRSGGADTVSVLVALGFVVFGPLQHTLARLPWERRTLAAGYAEGVEIALLHVTLSWVALMSLAAATARRIPGFAPWRLRLYPIRDRTLFGLAAVATWLQPSCWLLAVTSVLAATPLATGRAPAWGIAAAALWLAGAFLVGWATCLVTIALYATRRGRWIVASLLFALAVTVATPFALGGRLRVTAWHDWVFVHGARTFLLLGANRHTGLLVAWRGHTSGAWAAHAALGVTPALQCAKLGALAVVAAALAAYAFRSAWRADTQAARAPRGSRRAIGVLPWTSPALGGATRKECRVLGRIADTRVGVAFGVVAAIGVGVAPETSLVLVVLAMAAILLQNTGFAFNAFGADRAGVDRYRLLPLTNVQVLVSKNLALAFWVAVQIVPLAVACAARNGVAIGLAVLLGAASFCLMLASWGNLVSVWFPVPRSSGRAETLEQGGGLLGALLALAAAVVLGVTASVVGERGHAAVVVAQAGWCGLGVVTHALTLPFAARQFEHRAAAMRERLAG